MDRIKVRFDRLAARGEAALIPYFVAGYPSMAATREALWQAYEAGASLVELGIPFSDPVADGPTIQRASHAALKSGTTPRKVLALVRSLREEGFDLPMLGMTYANLVYAPGLERTLHEWQASGLDGAILPDVSLEDSSPFRGALAKAGLAHVAFAAPTSGDARMRTAMRACTGFLYVVGVYGTTGARATVSDETKGLVRRALRLRRGDRPPVCVGFGVSRPEHVARLVAAGAEGVIVGSALVDRLSRRQPLSPYLKSLKRATLGDSTSSPQRF